MSTGHHPPPPGGTPSRLESLCQDAYLRRLQDSCAGFVHLCRIDSRVLRGVRSNAISVLKGELAGHLTGMASSALRQEMVARLIGGAFPTKEHHNQYQAVAHATYETEQDVDHIEEMTQVGAKCNSVCCTGAFLVETMLAVVANEDVKRLDFNVKSADRTSAGFFHKNKMIKK